jgi:predicted acylesterase/phospholipase RssA
VAKQKKRLKLGLALGGGSARGFTHIGVLKVLHKHKIYPDYIAGTSAGAMVGAFYAAGHSPNDIEEIAKKTDWKKILDFTSPKYGLLSGILIEQKIRKVIHNKNFDELDIPLRVVSYNLDQHKKIVFSEGNVARSVRASLSIPGIFVPVKIGKYNHIDGGVVDPTPFDVVKEMGADIIIAVDLLHSEKKSIPGPIVKETSFISEFRQKFVIAELLNVKNYFIPTRWPKFFRTILTWTFDKLLYPAKVIRIMSGKEFPPIAKVVNEAMDVLMNNLARERLSCAKVDIKITPCFGNLDWTNLRQVEKFVEIGEAEMNKKIGLLKKKMGIK